MYIKCPDPHQEPMDTHTHTNTNLLIEAGRVFKFRGHHNPSSCLVLSSKHSDVMVTTKWLKQLCSARRRREEEGGVP